MIWSNIRRYKYRIYEIDNCKVYLECLEKLKKNILNIEIIIERLYRLDVIEMDYMSEIITWSRRKNVGIVRIMILRRLVLYDYEMNEWLIDGSS